MEFERLVSAQCESLIQMIHERREFLIDTIRIDKETKLRTLKVRHKLARVVIETNYQTYAFRSSNSTVRGSSNRPPDSYSSV